MHGLSVWRYLGGSAATGVVIGALAVGAISVRRAVAPGWRAASARLVEVIVAIATAVSVAQLLGTFGWFRQRPMLVGLTLASALEVFVGERFRGAERNASEQSPTSPRLEVLAAFAAGAVVAVQWTTHVAGAYGMGMTQGDSLWYHATFAGHFVESGRITGFYDNAVGGLSQPLFLPLNGSLVQAIAMLPFHSDLLSPLVNVGWAAVALLAAYVAAGPRLGALAVLGTVVLLGVPTISGTQPGQAPNDLATAALFLAAVALLFEGKLATAPTAVAGIAAGLALATKFTVVTPLAVLTLALLVVAFRRRALAAAMWWCVTLVIFGAYWFVRNWAHWHNPVPWMRVNIGPIDLPQRFHLTPSIVKFLGQWSEWRAWIFPGFATALGRSWWLILGLAFVGAIFAVARGPSLVERAVGASVLVGVVTVAFIQTGSDFAGAVFVFMVRYIEPALLVGFVLVVRALARAPDWVRRAITIVFVALTIVGTTSTYPELPAWPTHELLVAIVVVALTLGLIGVIRRTPNQAISVFAAAALVVVGAGWVVQRHYFSRRYIDAGLPHDHLNAFFQPISGARVDVLGTEHFYPIIGANLANNVVRELPTPTGAAASDCRAWRELLTRSGFDYVVIAHDPFSAGIQDPSWISTDPAATIVLQEQDVSVYEIRGRFEPNGCPPA